MWDLCRGEGHQGARKRFTLWGIRLVVASRVRDVSPFWAGHQNDSKNPPPREPRKPIPGAEPAGSPRVPTNPPGACDQVIPEAVSDRRTRPQETDDATPPLNTRSDPGYPDVRDVKDVPDIPKVLDLADVPDIPPIRPIGPVKDPVAPPSRRARIGDAILGSVSRLPRGAGLRKAPRSVPPGRSHPVAMRRSWVAPTTRSSGRCARCKGIRLRDPGG